MGSPVGYTHSRIPALTLMILVERRSDKTSLVSSEIRILVMYNQILLEIDNCHLAVLEIVSNRHIIAG
ncbi:MAG: hypothetical protein OSB33_06780 [Candidatus Poseidoniales archaeon]|nr:hypothetical protein [Candidatus Poseidoniales archaeon]